MSRTDRPPGYPARDEVTAELIRRQVPAGWAALLRIGGAASIFFAGAMAGSGEAPPPAAATPAASNPPTTQPGEAGRPSGKALPAAAIVAPIFEHGEGRAVDGCEVILPPVFLSEEEAFQVIKDELALHGITLTDRAVEVPDVQFRDRVYTFDPAGRATIVEGGKPRALKIDLVDPAKHVAVEFVGQSDYTRFGGVPSMSSVESYDMKGIATEVAGKVQKSSQPNYFGVFYDPGGFASKDARAAALKAPATQGDYNGAGGGPRSQAGQKKVSQAELRKQVRDFAEWLKGRGAI